MLFCRLAYRSFAAAAAVWSGRSLRGVCQTTRKHPTNARKRPQTAASTHKQVAMGVSTHKHPHKSFLRRPGAVFACSERAGALSCKEPRKVAPLRAETLIQQAESLARPHERPLAATGPAKPRFCVEFAQAERTGALRSRNWRCAGPQSSSAGVCGCLRLLRPVCGCLWVFEGVCGRLRPFAAVYGCLQGRLAKHP